MNTIIFLAWRFLKGAHEEQNLSVMIKICFIGIFIGTFALALVGAIAQGFEKATYQKMKTIHADGIMHASGQAIDFKKIEKVIKEEFADMIEAISPSTTQQIMLQNSEKESVTPALLLKALDSKSIDRISKLHEAVIEPKDQNLEQILSDKNILVGAQIAEQLTLKTGASVTLFYVDESESESSKISFSSVNAQVGGIFKTGIEECDEQLVFCSLDFLEKLFDKSAITEIGFAFKPNSDQKLIKERLKKRFKLEVQTWQDLYPALVSALTVQKYVMTLVIGLITLVACMNMLSLLFMYITQKRVTIAILKSLGMSKKAIRTLFITLGMGITAIASLAGLITAYAVGFLLQNYAFIELPDIYYVSHLPIALNPAFFTVVFLATLFLSFIASIMPAQQAARLAVTDILKQEL